MYKQEIKTFKLTFEMRGVFEIPEKNVFPESDPKLDYEALKILVNQNQFTDTIPIVIQFQQDLDRIKYYIESNLTNHSTKSTNIKLIYVSYIAFVASKLVKVSGKIERFLDVFKKSNLIITDNEDDGLC